MEHSDVSHKGECHPERGSGSDRIEGSLHFRFFVALLLRMTAMIQNVIS